MDLFIDWIVKPFLSAKAKNSITQAKQLGLTSYPSPFLGKAYNGQMHLDLAKKINKHVAKLSYTADPALNDTYNPPGYVEYKIVSGDKRKLPSYDCDDLALKAYRLALYAGVKETEMFLGNLLIAPWRQLFPYFEVWANHVIFCFKYGQWWGVIDTNTAYTGNILWYNNPTSLETEVIKTFNSTYKNSIYKKTNVEYYALHRINMTELQELLQM